MQITNIENLTVLSKYNKYVEGGEERGIWNSILFYCNWFNRAEIIGREVLIKSCPC